MFHGHIRRNAWSCCLSLPIVTILGGCAGTTNSRTDAAADDASVAADARSDQPPVESDLPVSDKASPDNATPADTAPDACLPRDEVCAGACGLVKIHVCPPEPSDGSIIVQPNIGGFPWCGKCPDCDALVAELQAAIEPIAACEPQDACVADFTLPCGVVYREGADLTAFLAAASTYKERCVDPTATYSCAELALACIDGRCR